MKGSKVIRSAMVAAGLAVVMTGTATAQSLTAARGPGYPVVATDARTAALGGLGMGLHGFSATMMNPAAYARAVRPGGVVALETIGRNVQLGDAEDELGTTRFPLLRVVFPVRFGVLTAGYGGYLDQSWGITREGEQSFGDQTVPYNDLLVAEGGVGQFQVGAAVPVGERFALGAAVGLHTGSQRVQYSRRFTEALEGVLDPFTQTMSWQYSGVMAQLGAQWAPADVLRLAASMTWAGTLEGEPTSGQASPREMDLPIQFAAGASGVLVPGLLATVSGRWSGWSGTDVDAMGLPPLEGGGSARDTWEVGGGLEWAPVRPAARRTFPLRVGAQYRQLPFPFVHEAPTELFVGGGMGLRVGPAESPLASVDLAIQRGTRTAAGAGAIGDLTERMWRAVLSVALFGN